MNSIVSNFNQILEFANEYQIPSDKKRSIIREYLQSKILEYIYGEKISKDICFVGGTALRLLHNLDRFSEDLDFDVKQTDFQNIKLLVKKIHRKLTNENVDVYLYQNTTAKRDYYELRFENLLFELNISRNPSEKLTIKLDFESFWENLSKEVVLFQRYGFLTNVVTISLSQILTQKLYAYLNRAQTAPRDIYDIVWLITHQAKVDRSFLTANKSSIDLISAAVKKYEKEKSRLETYKRQLKPFLMAENYIDKLDFFPELLLKCNAEK